MFRVDVLPSWHTIPPLIAKTLRLAFSAHTQLKEVEILETCRILELKCATLGHMSLTETWKFSFSLWSISILLQS